MPEIALFRKILTLLWKYIRYSEILLGNITVTKNSTLYYVIYYY